MLRPAFCALSALEMMHLVKINAFVNIMIDFFILEMSIMHYI